MTAYPDQGFLKIKHSATDQITSYPLGGLNIQEEGFFSPNNSFFVLPRVTTKNFKSTIVAIPLYEPSNIDHILLKYEYIKWVNHNSLDFHSWSKHLQNLVSTKTWAQTVLKTLPPELDFLKPENLDESKYLIINAEDFRKQGEACIANLNQQPDLPFLAHIP